MEVAHAVQAGGARQITIHARTKAEGYKPPAHWHYLRQVQRELQIPVIANGEIWSIADYIKCFEASDCHHIALGRTAIANPSLAREIKHYLSSQDCSPLAAEKCERFSWEVVAQQWLPSFLNLYQEQLGERVALHRGKQWIRLLGRCYPESLELFENIKCCQSFDELLQIVN
jgi:tRNA-dihydrouridine synthase C